MRRKDFYLRFKIWVWFPLKNKKWEVGKRIDWTLKSERKNLKKLSTKANSNLERK